MCGPFQLIWVKRKLFLATSLLYGLNTLYRVVVQALEINQSRAFTKQNIPLYLLFLMNICGQVYLIIKYFLSCRSSNPKQYKQLRNDSTVLFQRHSSFWRNFFCIPNVRKTKTRKVNFWSLFRSACWSCSESNFKDFRSAGCGNLHIRDIRLCH